MNSKFRQFKVLHTQIGPWPKDRVVTMEEFEAHNMTMKDVTRLVMVGALENTSEPIDTDALPTGPGMDDKDLNNFSNIVNERREKGAVGDEHLTASSGQDENVGGELDEAHVEVLGESKPGTRLVQVDPGGKPKNGPKK